MMAAQRALVIAKTQRRTCGHPNRLCCPAAWSSSAYPELLSEIHSSAIVSEEKNARCAKCHVHGPCLKPVAKHENMWQKRPSSSSTGAPWFQCSAHPCRFALCADPWRIFASIRASAKSLCRRRTRQPEREGSAFAFGENKSRKKQTSVESRILA